MEIICLWQKMTKGRITIMPRYNENRHVVPVLFPNEEYENLKRYAAMKNMSMSAVVREFTSKGLTGELTEANIDFLTPIIRSQMKSVMDAKLERVIALVAKTCIQAGTAAYLSAEALNSFVPPQRQKNFVEAYDAARAKSVKDLKKGGVIVTSSDTDEEESKS